MTTEELQESLQSIIASELKVVASELKAIEGRFDAMDKALVLQTEEFQRRIAENNHTQRIALENERKYLQTVVFDEFRKSMEISIGGVPTKNDLQRETAVLQVEIVAVKKELALIQKEKSADIKRETAVLETEIVQVKKDLVDIQKARLLEAGAKTEQEKSEKGADIKRLAIVSFLSALTVALIMFFVARSWG